MQKHATVFAIVYMETRVSIHMLFAHMMQTTWIHGSDRTRCHQRRKEKKTGSEFEWNVDKAELLLDMANEYKVSKVAKGSESTLLFSWTTPDKICFQHLYYVLFVAFSNGSTLNSVFKIKMFSCTFSPYSCINETCICKEKFASSVNSVSM